jgi:hypothetical protein
VQLHFPIPGAKTATLLRAQIVLVVVIIITVTTAHRYFGPGVKRDF